MATTDHREAVRVMEIGRTGIGGHVPLAGVDEFRIGLTFGRRRPHAKQTVLRVVDERPSLGDELRDQLRDSDTQIHIGTIGDVLSEPLRHFLTRPSSDLSLLRHG